MSNTKTIKISQHSEKYVSFHNLEGKLACDLQGQFVGEVNKGNSCKTIEFGSLEIGENDMALPEEFSEVCDRLVAEIVKELPKKERDTFIAIYLDRIEQAAYAQMRGVNRQTIHAQLQSIRKKIASKITSDPFWIKFKKMWLSQ